MKRFNIKFLSTLLPATALLAGSILLANTVMAEGLNGPHKHGELNVTVLKASGQLVFDIVVPAQDTVGYEYAPKSKKDKATLMKAEKSLYEVNNLNVLFNFHPKGSCWPFESYVNSDLLNIHEHPDKEKNKGFISKLAEKNHPKKAEDDVHVVGVGGHTDFVMSYTFDCGDVETVTLGFVKQFPSIKTINVREKNLKGKIVKTFNTSSKTLIDFSKL
jgi:hypothetical protein